MTSLSTITHVADDGAFAAVVDHLLVPIFPPSERGDRSDLMAMFRAGDLDVWASWEDGQPIGTAIGSWPSDPNDVILLTWLAVGEAGRGRGLGSALIETVREAWRESFDPLLILGEVEDPDFHEGSAATGDPAARLRFYEQRGARRVDLPFVMPRVTPRDRVEHMLLLALGGRALTAGGPDGPSEREIAAAIDRFLRAYLEMSAEPVVAGRYCEDIEAMLEHAPHARLL
ncbi:MAG: GNAT family N-acetyltransferase [Bowdeniella nasicola]|nr:GNAT family N-acetyltransferase [Bowdeniella nasicola]